MFNKNSEDYEAKGSAETIIGKSVKIEGEFNGEGNIIVEGEVQGNLKTNKDLNVKQGAKITADTEADNMKIAGIIEGNVKCHGSLDIASTGKIIGNVETKIIAIAAGATIKGQITSDGDGSTSNHETDDSEQDQE